MVTGLLLLGLMVSGQPVEELLASYRGQPLLVELPDLVHLGSRLRPPSGWQFLQASSENVTELATALGSEPVPALLYVDRYGNLLYRDASRERRSRITVAVAEFHKRSEQIRSRSRKLWRNAHELRNRGKQAEELQKLLAILNLNVLGYPDVLRAQLRIDELSRDRQRQFLEVLAGEGLESRQKLEQQLRRLLQISIGLPVVKWIRRELVRLKSGIVVLKRSR